MNWISVKDKLPDSDCIAVGVNVNYSFAKLYTVIFNRGVFTYFDTHCNESFPIQLTHYCLIDFGSIPKDTDELD